MDADDKEQMTEFDASLLDKVMAGNAAAREAMIVDNMPFVEYRVDVYLYTYPKYQYLRDDLTSEGYVGLVESVNEIAKGEQGDFPHDNPGGFVGMMITEALSRCVVDDAAILIPRRSRQRLRDKAPEAVNSLSTIGKVVDAKSVTTTSELREEILAACQTPIDESIIRMRSQGFNDDQIADATGFCQPTISILRREIYDRFLSRNPEFKGKI